VDDVISRWWLLAAIISGIGKGKEKRSAEGGIGSGAWDRGSKRGQIKSDHNKKITTRKESGIKSSKKSHGNTKKTPSKEDRPGNGSSSQKPMKIEKIWSKRRRERRKSRERGHLLKRQNIKGLLEKARGRKI
jgi:hypothetical protein